jgi:hypothetical protein
MVGEKGNVASDVAAMAAGAVVEKTTSVTSTTVMGQAAESTKGLMDRVVEKAEDRTVERIVDAGEEKLRGRPGDEPES